LARRTLSILAGGVVEALRIELRPLTVTAAAGCPPELPTGLSATELLTALTAAAIRESAEDLELLHSVPLRDDDQFGDRPRPDGVDRLSAWLYSASNRVAYAVHTPDWTSPAAGPAQWSGPAGWRALLHEHLHGDFHAGHGWTPVNAVAMPVRRPFDELGLRVRPLLALWPPVSQQADDHLSETMVAGVHEGRPQVVAVQVFSAAAYLRHLTRAGQRWFEFTAADRRPDLIRTPDRPTNTEWSTSYSK
jgi:hypothetical protein